MFCSYICLSSIIHLISALFAIKITILRSRYCLALLYYMTIIVRMVGTSGEKYIMQQNITILTIIFAKDIDIIFDSIIIYIRI